MILFNSYQNYSLWRPVSCPELINTTYITKGIHCSHKSAFASHGLVVESSQPRLQMLRRGSLAGNPEANIEQAIERSSAVLAYSFIGLPSSAIGNRTLGEAGL